MKTKKTIEIGKSDFKKMVINNHYLVDKTELIYEFFNSNAYISLMPRPKRFGKTLNLSMIEHFFDINKKENKNLFDNFKISDNKDFCKEHQNKYPVINLSLKNIKASNWTKCYETFKKTISKLYKTHVYLLKSDTITENDKDIFEQIIKRTASETDYEYSLRELSEYLQAHFQKDVIILIDEYDTPIIYAYANTTKPLTHKDNTTYYGKVIEFMQTFFGEAFKGNNTLQKGLLTGIMRIAKESIFSEWNNFKAFSITSPYFADKFGFTEAETEKLLKYFNLYDNFKSVKQWYDGYKFGDINQIYNPWSIVNYIAFNKEGLQAHWVNTSRDVLIKDRIIEPYVKQEIEKLIAGEIIKKDIDENFIFADFHTNKELLWTLLVHSGYLTQIKKVKLYTYELKIPNYEVKTLFQRIIIKWLDSEVKIKRDLLIKTAEYLINNKIPEFEKGFKKLVQDTISYYDTAQQKDKNTKEIIISKEQIFHVYTLGLLAILSDDFIIKANREAGDGRYDIMLIPFDKTKNGVVIEIKQIDKRKNEKKEIFYKRINTKIKEGLNQINKNEYYKELLEHKIKKENIIKLAIVFASKEPFVQQLKIEKNI